MKKPEVQAASSDLDPKQHCAVRNNFIAPNSCRLVEGTISPNGWCSLFIPEPA